MHELRTRIANLATLEERLDHVDWFKRLWMASYAADVAIISDCLLELLDGAPVPQDDADAAGCPVCVKGGLT